MSRVRNIVALALLANLCLGILLVSPGTAQTTPLEWSRPIPISGALSGSRFPSIVAEDDGTLFLFWSFTQAGEGNAVFVSRSDAGVWQRPVDVLLGGPRPMAFVDDRNIIHMLLMQGENVSLMDATTENATSVRGWNAGVTLNKSGGGDIGDLLFDDTGGLYTVWLQRAGGCDNCFSVAYQEFTDQTDPALTYRVISDLVDAPQHRLQLRGSPTGTMYALWDVGAREDVKAGIQLSLSTDGGETWLDEPREVRFDEEDILQPLLFLDSNNNLVLVYNFGVKDEVYYSVSSDEGVTWTQPAAVPGLFASKQSAADDYFAAATDSAGLTHLLAAGRTSKRQVSPGLYHVAWDGTAWTDFQEVFHADTTVEYPSIALSQGNQMHVSFSTRDRNPVGATLDGTAQVWYTTALTNAPAQTRVPLPTFTPTPTVTPSPQATAVQTPTATPTPAEPDDSSGDTAINPQQPIVIAIGAVVLILILVVVLNAVIRGRR